MSSILNHDIFEIGRQISNGALSPMELTQAALNRAESTEPSLNAYVSILRDDALRVAEQAESEIKNGNYRGPLHGIPVAIKDLYDIAGLPTTCSSDVLTDYVAPSDSACVSALKQAGAIIIGKTHTHEFAYGAVTPTSHNPWDLEYSPGGSSGGSGAAVASRSAFLALGTDTGGSIRIPSAACGISGIKPTYGLLSRHGVFSLSWSLDHTGPMAKTALDLAIGLNALASYDSRDNGSANRPREDYGRFLNRDIRGMRLGVPSNFYFNHVDAEISALVHTAIDELENAGAILVPVDVPGVDNILAVEYGILMPEASAQHYSMLRERPELYQDDVRDLLIEGSVTLAIDYIAALRHRTLIRSAWSSMFVGNRLDALVAPATAVPAVKRGQTAVQWPDGSEEVAIDVFVRLSAPVSVTGFPAAAIPCGMTKSSLPASLQIIGLPFSESKLLQLANAYQKVTDWHKMVPPLVS